MQVTKTIRTCDMCGAAASWSTIDDEAVRENHCEECARYWGTRARGEADAALETIGFAVELARKARVSDDQLRRAFEEILTRPVSTGSYPIGGDFVLARDARDDHPWKASYTPLAENEAVA